MFRKTQQQACDHCKRLLTLKFFLKDDVTHAVVICDYCDGAQEWPTKPPPNAKT
jgi:hypothetical protein